MIRATRVFSLLAPVLMLTMAGYLNADETKGTIKSTDATKSEVVLKGTISNSVYELTKDAYVCLDGVKSTIADLKEGDHAVIVYDKKGEHMMAGEVRGLRNAKEASGTVGDIFSDKNEITIKGVLKNTTYEMNKSGTIWLNGQKSALTDIRAGDNVLLTYEQKGDRYVVNCVRAARK